MLSEFIKWLLSMMNSLYEVYSCNLPLWVIANVLGSIRTGESEVEKVKN